MSFCVILTRCDVVAKIKVCERLHQCRRHGHVEATHGYMEPAAGDRQASVGSCVEEAECGSWDDSSLTVEVSTHHPHHEPIGTLQQSVFLL